MTLDDPEYQAGKRAFERGDTLELLFVHLHDSNGSKDEAKSLSYALGFADALLNDLRGIAR